jgi:hypothetical protein
MTRGLHGDLFPTKTPVRVVFATVSLYFTGTNLGRHLLSRTDGSLGLN